MVCCDYIENLNKSIWPHEKIGEQWHYFNILSTNKPWWFKVFLYFWPGFPEDFILRYCERNFYELTYNVYADLWFLHWHSSVTIFPVDSVLIIDYTIEACLFSGCFVVSHICSPKIAEYVTVSCMYIFSLALCTCICNFYLC